MLREPRRSLRIPRWRWLAACAVIALFWILTVFYLFRVRCYGKTWEVELWAAAMVAGFDVKSGTRPNHAPGPTIRVLSIPFWWNTWVWVPQRTNAKPAVAPRPFPFSAPAAAAPKSASFTLPLYLPFLGVALPTAILLIRDLRAARAGQCPHCRYDLKGLPEGAPCPECGNPAHPFA